MQRSAVLPLAPWGVADSLTPPTEGVARRPEDAGGQEDDAVTENIPPVPAQAGCRYSREGMKSASVEAGSLWLICSISALSLHHYIIDISSI